MNSMATKNVILHTFPFFFFFILLLRAGESRAPFACDAGNSNFPFCRVSLPVGDRVKDLVGRLTLQEKIRLIVNNAAPVDRLGIQGYEWWSEALHGVSNTGPGVTFGGEFPAATSFPQVITTAASYNATLWTAIGQAVSTEARAMYNGGAAGLSYWSPNVNIFRDPRWGRGQETPGEDPTLSARYAASYVRGLQDDGGGQRLKVAACCKHYTAYDLDSWKGVDRFHFNAKTSLQDLEETFNVPFKACVVDGRVASVMCSYNQVNGKPTCADPSLLRGTVRGEWKLNGYIVSDCDSVEVMYDAQHYTSTPEDSAADSIKAGLDLDCGPFLADHTEDAIREGKLGEADVDQALGNLLTVQMRLGMFDGPNGPYSKLGPNDVCTPAHKQLAHEAAQQGIVLLLNRNGALPLSAARYPTVAVIGPNADATETMIGNYAGVPCEYTTPLQGISRYAKTNYETGCTDVGCASNSQFSRAIAAAGAADATVLVMGLNQDFEREGLDREGLLLPGHQQELVSAVAAAAKGPVVLVLLSGGPIDVTFAKNDPKIAAILWAGYPGEAGGAAIADVLFGAVNPSGKLPMTWYPQDYADKVDMTDMTMRPDPSRGFPGRTYRFYKGPVVFPFGFGLSYTKFKHNLAAASLPENKLGLPLNQRAGILNHSESISVSRVDCESVGVEIEVDVENVGGMGGSETVAVFSSCPATGKRLIGFEKVHVAAGGKERVKFNVNPCEDLSMVDEHGIRRIQLGQHSLHIGQSISYTFLVHIHNAAK